MNKFTPKGEDILRQELLTETGLDPNNEDNKDFIEKTVKIRLKDQELLASFHSSKEKKKETIAEKEKKIAELEAKLNPKGDDKTKINTQTNDETRIRQIIAEEQFLVNGGTNTDLRHLKEIMKATNKSFSEAQKSTLYIAYKDKLERDGISRSSQLPPSRGGSYSKVKTDEDKIAEKNIGNLPPGFTAEVKK